MDARTERFPVIGLLLALVAFLLYFPTLRFGFLTWDDYALVVGNPLVTEHSWTTLLQLFTTFDPQFYAPLTYLSFRIEHLFFGLNPMVFHATNVLLHAVNSVLVFFVVQRFLPAPRSGAAAFFVILFAIHPLNVEAVAWISARKHLLVTCFMLLSILFHGKRPVVTFLLCISALLSSVSAVVLPVLLLLIGPTQKGQDPSGPLAHPGILTLSTLKFLTPYVVLAMVFGIVGLFGMTHYAPQLSLWDLLRYGGEGLLLTLGHSILPTGLVAVYTQTSFVHLLLGAFGLVFLAQRQRSSILFFLIAFAPSLFAISKASGMTLTQDRYAYLPLVFLLIALLSLLERIPRRFLLVLLMIVTLFFGVLSYDRMQVWANDCAFYRSGVRSAKTHPRLQAGYAEAVAESATGCAGSGPLGVDRGGEGS